MKSGSEGIACSSSTGITTSGQTARLLSLAALIMRSPAARTAMAGPHALLWDRRLRQRDQVRFDLFSTPTPIASVLRDPYCRALNAERKKRRGPDYQPSSMVPEFRRLSQILRTVPDTGSGTPASTRSILIAGALYRRALMPKANMTFALPVTARPHRRAQARVSRLVRLSRNSRATAAAGPAVRRRHCPSTDIIASPTATRAEQFAPRGNADVLRRTPLLAARPL